MLSCDQSRRQGTSIREAFEFLGGGTNHVVCVCVCVEGGWDSGGKRAIYNRVQLLTLAKACNRFLMCAVLSVSLPLSKSITFSKEGRGWKVGGTVTRLGGHGPRMPPPWRRPWLRCATCIRCRCGVSMFSLKAYHCYGIITFRICVIYLLHVNKKQIMELYLKMNDSHDVFYFKITGSEQTAQAFMWILLLSF